MKPSIDVGWENVGALSAVPVSGGSAVDKGAEDEQTFVFYDRCGDFVEFFAVREPYTCEFLDEHFTVYISRDSTRVIGGQLCQFRSLVAKILERAPNFVIEVRNDEVSLNALFTAFQWTNTGELKEASVSIYEELREVVKQVDKPVPFERCALA